MAEIYGLFSGRDWIVRYVGETAGPREDRLWEHIKNASGALRDWFLDEWKHGYPIRCALLAECEYNGRFDVETTWINKFPSLINERKHYYWRSRTQPVVPAIIKHRRRYRYNVGGFRGVHYDVQMDRYFVLISPVVAGGDPDLSGRAGTKCQVLRPRKAATSGSRIAPVR